MLQLKREGLFFSGLVVFIFMLTWIIQEKLYLHWDLSFLLNTTRQLLAGGSYSKEFFTPNTPMTLYLYAPPVIVSKWLMVSIIPTFRIYIFLLSSLSLILCYWLIQHIFLKQDSILRKAFLFILISTFLILPLEEYGQRDHLLLILTMPYILMVAYRLQGNSVPLHLAIIGGILAGLGLSIKPHFLILPVLIESYYMFAKRNWLGWVRTETITFILVITLYIVALFVFHRDYLFIVLPHMVGNYYQSISAPWAFLFINNFVFFFTFCFLFYCVRYKENHYEPLATILCLALLSFFLCFLAQRTLFHYHFLPPFSLALLLFTLTYGLFIRKHLHFFIILVGISVYAFPISFIQAKYQFAKGFKENVLNQLVAFLHTQKPHRSIYILSEMNYGSLLIEYAGARVMQRFDSLWMIHSLFMHLLTQGDTSLRNYLKNKDEYFFLNMIADDLQKNRPDLVFVDTRQYNSRTGGVFGYFDYLNYFSENPRFRTEWKAYHYLTTISNEPNRYEYKFDVYSRR